MPRLKPAAAKFCRPVASTAWRVKPLRSATCPPTPARQPAPPQPPQPPAVPLRPEPGLAPLPDVDPDAMSDGPDPRPLIDRRQMPRVAFAARAALAPADATGAVRPPAIHTRDLNAHGLGFTARQDLSVLGEATLMLPADRAGRWVTVPCRVRRSRELGNGWYDGLVEFLVPQPELTIDPAGHARLPRPRGRRRE